MANNNSSNGSGILTILLIVFIVLRLVHVINWSWWWVLAPFWLPVALMLLFLVVVAIFVRASK